MTTSIPAPSGTTPITIEEEMRRSYLDYAMSVIVSRALPDVRDGLKPVHRRILYAMKEAGNDYNRPYRKSARVVGETMGKYHPHGDIPIYDAMARMAQDFSLRVPLIDGQGNFGSMDGDPPASMRYTEARLAKVAHVLLEDTDKDTVDFQPNYDDSLEEPTVLPARFPNLLVNGAGGIAVGMATNIPPHNLGEVIDAACAYVDHPEISVEELIHYVPGPDFPTGGQVLGRGGILEAYRTGRGSILMRGKTHFEEIRKDRHAIIITEVPFQVNKSRLLERIAEVVNSKIIEGISDLRDESDRDGVRVVIELKRDAVAEVVLNQLYKYTPLQQSFGANILALHKGRPLTLNLKEIIQAFVEFREQVITRRTRFDLKKARGRAHHLVGLAVAVINVSEVIALIRAAKDPQAARQALMERDWPVEEIIPFIELVDDPDHPIINQSYKLSEIQAKAILDLRLHRLTGLEREKIIDELKSVIEEIKEYLHILASRIRLLEILKAELIEVKTQFATPRRTELLEGDYSVETEDLIQREEMVVTVSLGGYIKRVPVSTYRAQKRGGKGRSGMSTRDEDIVSDVFVANTHTPLLFFSNLGQVYKLKVYKLPLGSAQSRGKAMINIFPLQQGEYITTVMPMPEDENEWENLHIFFATSTGNVRRNSLADFTNIRASGKIAMKFEDAGETLIGVKTCTEDQDAVLTTYFGRCIRFSITQVRVFAGRSSTGVRGIRLAPEDKVISLALVESGSFTTEERDAYLKQASKLRRGEEETGGFEAPDTFALSEDRFNEMAAKEEFLLTITEKGYGKRTSSYEYRAMNRGAQGFAAMEVTEKTGNLVAAFPVQGTDHMMLVTDKGQLIRFPVEGIRIVGRKTQGVLLFRVGKDEKVVSSTRLSEEDAKEEEEAGEEAPENSVSAEAISKTSQEDTSKEE